MANPIPRYSLEVVGGEDHGAKIVVDLNVRTIGRARDADLVLRDLAVSRRHVQVVANEGGVSFATLPSASPFVADGRPVRSLDAKPGDRILLGNTMIVVGGGPEAGAATPPAHTDVRTLLTGAAADVRGLAAAHALVDALDAAADAPAIALAVRAWAADHLGASEAEVERIEARRAGGAAVEETREASGAILVTVPAPCAEPVRLAVRFPATAGGVTDPHRRTLVVAGRILGAALARARQVEVAEGEVAALRTLGVGSARTYLGHSEEAKRIATLIPRVGALDFGVLIEGETGVGKTFVARLIHESSPRAREPLRIINCAAIPEALLESELFGHERGAFTGAMTARAGAFEAVGGGTLLLDEVGELSLAGQAKLLRVLEERRFERVGSNRSIELRARVLCATNRDLEALVRSGGFRSDLFFRISAVRLRVPPLRERGDDVVLLAEQILGDVARSAPRRLEGFAPDALEVVRRYPWPGNVRELRNAIEHAVALGDGAKIEARDFPMGMAVRVPPPTSDDVVQLPLDLASLERRAIEAALRATDGQRAKAAALLGINRTTLYNKLKEYGIG